MEYRDIQGYEGKYQLRFDVYGNPYVWSFLSNKKLVGANRGGYTRIGFFDKKRFDLHRLVATHYIPNPNNLPDVDHIISNEKQNCKLDNLRWSTHGDNNHNSKLYFNYCLDKWSNRWKASIFYNGKHINLGRFDSEEDAKKAGESGSRKYYPDIKFKI